MDENQIIAEISKYEDISKVSIEQLKQKKHLIDAETNTIKQQLNTLLYEINEYQKTIRENQLKIKRNKVYPFLVGTYNEHVNGNSATITNSMRISYYLPNIGLTGQKDLHPGDSVALHKESNIVFQKLKRDYDESVKSMKAKETHVEFQQIGGCEKQIEELNEAIILPIKNSALFTKLKIKPPKGVLLYGPPGTGKTLIARAIANQCGAYFLKLAGPQLVQMYIGEGARLVRETFALAAENSPSIIFIDEIDAIGCKRSDQNETGDREVQRTLLELLAQIDGFTKNDVRLICATNRPELLDPALIRSGRLDCKIEFPLPNEEGREQIIQIHSRQLKTGTIHFEEIAKMTEGFNGAQCRAVAVEAGMCALNNNKSVVEHEDFLEAVNNVKSHKKSKLEYFS